MNMHNEPRDISQEARDMKVGGLITACIAPGIAAFGFLLPPAATMPLLGTAALMICIGAGLVLAAHHMD